MIKKLSTLFIFSFLTAQLPEPAILGEDFRIPTLKISNIVKVFDDSGIKDDRIKLGMPQLITEAFQDSRFNLIDDDSSILEKDPLENASKIGELMAYKHEGFWQCMDTKRDKDYLEDLLRQGKLDFI